MDRPLRIGALISGGGTNLQAIIDSCSDGRINGQMVFVGTDNPEAKGLARAQTGRIPTFVVDYRQIIRQYKAEPGSVTPPADFDLEEMVTRQRLFPAEADPERVNAVMVTRAVAEAAMLSAMEDTPFDLLVLAGFMRNVTPYFIDRVNADRPLPRIMNIHPALLPSFPGIDGYGDTFRYGCKVGGCTVHFIDYGEDSGPIIGQRAFPILPEDTLDTIRDKGLKEEWQLYPECIQLYAEQRLRTEVRTYQLPNGQQLHRPIVVIDPPSA